MNHFQRKRGVLHAEGKGREIGKAREIG